jgi:general secretion pathway protein D
MKKIARLFCAVALASALPLLPRAQNAPVPQATPQGAAAFNLMSAPATATTPTVVLLASNAAAPVALPLPAAVPPATMPGAAGPALPPAPGAIAAQPAPLPAGPAAAPFAGPAFPIIPRLPGPGNAAPVGVAPTFAPLAGGPTATNSDSGVQLNFRDAPLDQLLNMYGDLTGRTVIKGPLINAIITVRSQNSLTVPEAIQALESVLQLNGIALVPMGTKFVKVTKSELGRMESLALKHGGKDSSPVESDQLVSYIFTLKFIETDDVVPALQNVLHTYGKIQVLERANSVMLTDTSANIQRAQEILEFMDVPPEARVETKVYELENGDAMAIAAQLQSIVDDAQGKNAQQRPRQTGAPMPIPMVAPGAARSASVGGGDTALEDGLIQGKVKILSDDRTNMIIIIARPSNFPFFERLIKELDRKVEPEVVVRVVQLHWTTADNIVPLLNDMLGSSGGTYGQIGQTAGGTTSSTLGGGASGSSLGARSTASSTAARRTSTGTSATTANRTATGAARPGGATGSPNPFGNNAPNVTTTTRVIGDKRSNSLLMMGTKEDIADLEKVIEKLDVMLSQVLLEVAILEVDLTKTTESGVSWLQRSLQAYNLTSAGPGGGAQVLQPIASFGGGWNPGTANASIPNGASIVNGTAMPGGLNYYTTISGLNLDTVIHLVNRSSDARVLSTPVIMAIDNQDAKLNSTTQRPVITSSTILTTGTASSQSTYEYKDIGIELDVTPHINPNRMIVLDINVTSDTISGEVVIDGNSVPVISARNVVGTITMEDRTTVVLGGLSVNSTTKTRDSIPILGSIPLIGWLFRDDSNVGNRTELLVLISPYICKTPEEARAETKRFHDNSEMKDVLVRGWSNSDLAKPDPEIERANRKRTIFGKDLTPGAPADATMTNAAPSAAK